MHRKKRKLQHFNRYHSDNTVHKRDLGNYNTHTTTLQHTRCPQTYKYDSTTPTKTIPRPDREQYIRSNAAIARPLTLVRPTESSTHELQNTNEPLEMVISIIMLLYTIQDTRSIGTLLSSYPTVRTITNALHLKTSNLEKTTLNRC